MLKILKFTILAVLYIIILNSFLFIGISVYRSVHAYVLVAQGKMEERPGVHLAESLDGFLIALVFIVFSMGVAKFFVPNSGFLKGYELPWLKLDSFSSLKLILWEMLLTTMFVFFAAKLVISGDNLDWSILITPAAILMLSIAYKLIKHGH